MSESSSNPSSTEGANSKRKAAAGEKKSGDFTRKKGRRLQAKSAKKSNAPRRQESAVPKGWIEVGKIKSPHGLRGLVRIRSLSDFPERFTVPGDRWLWRPGQGEPKPVTLVQGTFQSGKKLYLVQFEEVSDRNISEAWVGASVLVPEEDRLELEEDEFHYGDLIGVSVYHQETGECLGKVTAVIPAGNDLLEVTDSSGSDELGKGKGDHQVLIPFMKVFVPVVDIEGDRIEVTPPEGLIG